VAVFHGYQTDELATWIGLLDAVTVFERHIWTALRIPLPPALQTAKDELEALARPRRHGGSCDRSASVPCARRDPAGSLLAAPEFRGSGAHGR
jgi:hypothetical protein